MIQGRTANVAGLLFAALTAVILVSRLGQMLIFSRVDWEQSADPIALIDRVVNLLNFIVYPLAAVTGGGFVAAARLRWWPTVAACALVIGPLWAFQLSGEIRPLNIALCFGLLAAALLPRLGRQRFKT